MQSHLFTSHNCHQHLCFHRPFCICHKHAISLKPRPALCDDPIMNTTTLPTLPDPTDGLGGYGLPSTIRSIQNTGFRRWGFRIYRCKYDDEDAWNRYVGNLETKLRKGLEATGSDYMLTPYHEWTIVEDHEALDGASKADVRSRFRQ